jgi:nicotinamide-nucleotide amidase
VHLAIARRGGETLHRREMFPGDRRDVRLATVECAFRMLREAAE